MPNLRHVADLVAGELHHIDVNRRDPSDLLVIISAREVESRYRCEPGGGFLLFLAGSDGGF